MPGNSNISIVGQRTTQTKINKVLRKGNKFVLGNEFDCTNQLGLLQQIRFGSMEEEVLEKATIVIKGLEKTEKEGRSEIMYRQVIEKNFQTIAELLRKLNFLSARQEDFQNDIQTHNKRLNKIEAEMESIHNEHRRDNFHLISNIQELKSEITGMDSHMKKLMEEWRKQGYMLKFQRVADEIEEFKQSYREPSCKISQIQPKFHEESHVSVSESESSQTSTFVMQIHNNNRPQLQHGSINQKMIRQSSDNYTDHDMGNQLQSRPNSKLIKNKKKIGRNSMDDKFMLKKVQTKMVNIAEARPKTNKVSNLKNLTMESKSETRSISKQGKQQQLAKLQIKQKEKQIQQDEFTEEKAINNIRQPLKISADSKIVSSLNGHSNYSNFKQIEQDRLVQGQKTLEAKSKRQKIRHLQKLVQQLTLKNQTLDRHIDSLSQQLQGLARKSNFLVHETKLSDEVTSLLSKLTRLKEHCYQTFASKTQTKRALVFMDSRLKTLANQPFQYQISPSGEVCASSIVSKCLGCNRRASASTDTSKHTGGELGGLEGRISFGDLKKRTIEVLKKQRRRNYSKLQRSH